MRIVQYEKCRKSQYAVVAQLVERILGKDEVDEFDSRSIAPFKRDILH